MLTRFLRVVGLFCLINLGAIGSAIADQTGYAFVSTFGTFGSANGQFANPYGVAVDSDDNIYVADTFRHRFQKFSSSGAHLLTVGGPTAGSGPGQFNNPTDIAVDSGGNIYVLDQLNLRVQKFQADGTYIGSPITGFTALGLSISLAQDGSIFVFSYNTNEVKKFDPSGNLLLTFGQGGSGNAILTSIVDVSVIPDGDVLVAQLTSPAAVKRYSSSGVYKSQIGSPGSGAGQYDTLNSVKANASGQVFVSDEGLDRIASFASTGTFLESFGSSGTANGEFDHPYGFALDSTGRLVVADVLNNRIQIFAPPNLVTVVKDGAGAGTVTSSDALISCGTDCAERYSAANTVTLSASPSEGAYLSAWSGGACAADSTTCSFAPATNTTVTASFGLVPATTITEKPDRRTESRTATFSFKATGRGLSYECKLDDAAFKPCRSPKSYKNLRKGAHTFQVRALKRGSPGLAKSASWRIR